ncbi:MAG: hypothetical protein QNJ53_17265 [Pleurocapsa sp. MO_192.B19]|nr:hypothetical protein [Pleurocapsa sp. MO_192.B19]
MESSIAQDFVNLGIPEEQIVFAYLPEQQVALTK